MGRQNIYQTLSGQSFMPEKTLTELVDFLIANRGYVLSTDERRAMFSTRPYGHSYINDFVRNLATTGSQEVFSLLRIPSRTTNLREAVDIPFMPTDLLQIRPMVKATSEKTLSLIPELNDKLIINITDMIKANGDFQDISRLNNRIVRDFLSRNYYNSTGSVWISSSLVRYVAKVYSMTIGGQLARFFNLSNDVQSFIQTVFCAFYVGQMTTPDVAETFLKSNAKQLVLPQGHSLDQILGFIKDIIHKAVPASLEDVFAVIDAYDHDQLKSHRVSRLNRPVLSTKLATLASDKPVAMVALEYPPYFLYLIMMVLSGERIGLAFPMKNLNLIKEGKEVMDQTLKISSLYKL